MSEEGVGCTCVHMCVLCEVACVGACIHRCVCILHVSVHMCICVHCKYARVRVYPQCVGMSVYVCMCECVYMCTCVCSCVDVCRHVCITRDILLVWLHTHVSVYMDVYMCT